MISSAREVELEGEVAALRGELTKLASMLDSVRATVIEESEPEIVRLALAVAKRLVGREVTADPTILHRWIEEGAKSLPNRAEITIAASPDIADDGVRLGGWRVTVGSGRLVVDGTGSPADWWRAVVSAGWHALDQRGVPVDTQGLAPPRA